MRPIVRYHGGKWKMAKTIIQNFPHHRIYVEPYGGGGSVLLQKSRSYAEVYNDIYSDIVNVFKVLRNPDHAQRLKELCELTPFAREEFEAAINREESIEWARQVIFRSFAGFGSGSSNENHNTGFRANSNRSGTTPAHDWANWPSHIVDFVARLRGVVIENRAAMDVIRHHDSVETLHYLDPPYMHDTRRIHTGKNGVYQNEMTNEDHVALLDFVQTVKGKVLISGYRNDIYDDALKNWYRVDFGAMADGARKRTESIWMNYKNLTLF